MDTYILVKQFVVAALLLAAFGYFAVEVRRLVRIMRGVKGSTPVHPPPLPGQSPGAGTWGERLRILCSDVLGQSNVRRKKGIGLAHTAIFFGFLCVQPHSLELMIRGFIPSFSWHALIPSYLYSGFMFAADWLALFCLLGFAYVLYRRLRLRPPYLPQSRDAFLIILFTTLIVFTYLLLNAMATVSTWAGNGMLLTNAPVSGALASLLGMNHWSQQSLRVWFEIVYWIHLGIILGFLVYLPGSKHLHLLAAVPNVALKPLHTEKNIARTDVEDENAETFGLGFINELNWKQVLDLYACTECGRCEEQCPAARTGKALSPRELIHGLRLELFEQAEDIVNKAGTVPAIFRQGGRLPAARIWECVTCRACEEVCPVNIQHLDFLFELRKHQVLMEAAFPPELGDTFGNLENQSNPWGLPSASRGDWAADLGLPRISQCPDAEIVYFAGSALSLDDRGRKVSRALLRVLKAAGVRVALLGADERDTGDDARRSGNEYLAQAMIRANVEMLNNCNVRAVLTACPHTYNILRNEYPDFGGNYAVFHHSVYLEELFRQGRLPLAGINSPVRFAYHDSCYLGRWNGIFEQPRALLRRLSGGAPLLEMASSREKSLCCGGGGGRMFMEESGRRVNALRAEQAAATGADILAVSCPYCMTMLTDGLKEIKAGARVMDIAEILEERLATG